MNVQSLIDYARSFPEITPLLGVSGYSNEPAITLTAELLRFVAGRTFSDEITLKYELPVPEAFEELLKKGFVALCRDNMHVKKDYGFRTNFEHWQQEFKDAILQTWQNFEF